MAAWTISSRTSTRFPWPPNPISDFRAHSRRRSRDMRRHVFTGVAFCAIALAAPGWAAAAQNQKADAKPVVPIFEVDANFPTLPDHMLMGGVGGATADSHG